MSTFRRLLGTAQKALDSRSTSSTGSGQGSDWRSLVRSAADSLTGDSSSSSEARGHGRSASWHDTTTPRQPAPARSAVPTGSPARSGAFPAADLSAKDHRAIARYDYLVRTAEPDQLERVHREAFENLTPHQRAQLSASLSSELPAGERPRTDAPQDMARSATRLGVIDPRHLTSLLGRSGGGRRGLGAGAVGAGALGAGALGAGGLLAAVAGGAVVTSVGGSLLQEALGGGIDIDSLAPDLANELGGFVEGFEGVEGVEGVEGFDGLADGVGGTVNNAGEQVSGLGDRISDLGLGDLFGR